MEKNISLAKAKRSLEGLSVGDAFGELFFRISPYETTSSQLPSGTWRWTDDTHMALSIVEVLEKYGCIDQDALAQAFARRFTQEPHRGYAGGAMRLLTQISTGGNWRVLSPRLFGSGSFGNGSAMRVAPIGGYFFNDLKQATEQAQLSAVVTHAHVEGQAGAIAVAVSAAIAANDSFPKGNDFLKEVLPYVPDSITKERIQLAMQITSDDINTARQKLGTGNEVACQDTVPFCLWCSAHNLDDFEQALWLTAKGFGDVDTTCAIVGGIVALSAKEIPALWLKHREPLPS
ncbi:MAG TPA: ADP-ribosylglycohydrolase family protein [Anaerolineales bacterium]|nr:ADP-ribosylglycohydrolase family protein [Anaerolineales bacterium]